MQVRTNERWTYARVDGYRIAQFHYIGNIYTHINIHAYIHVYIVDRYGDDLHSMSSLADLTSDLSPGTVATHLNLVSSSWALGR